MELPSKSASGPDELQPTEFPISWRVPLLKDKPELADDLRDHQTFESWGKDGFELAKRAVYLNGQSKP